MTPSAAALLPPGPKGLPLIGSMGAFTRDPITFLQNVSKQYGDICRFRLVNQPIVLLNHPDLVREVLVTQAHRVHKGRALERSKRLLGEGLLTSEGAQHKRQRLLVQPAFHKQRIESYAQAMVACADATSKRWQTGEIVDMAEEMRRLTLAIVGLTLFDADVEGDADAVGQALESVLANFNVARLHLPAWLDGLPLPRNRRFARARTALDATIFRMIAERRASGKDHQDLLSMLLAARDDEGDGGGMSDQQVRDEAMTLFLAGHETTATALTWTWYLLSQHPVIEENLQEELQRVLGDRLPGFADLGALPYTRMILSEAMRLFPPAWVVGRRVVEPLEIGPYTLPINTVVLVSQYVMHHDARYFPDPERFDPERWTPEAVASRPRFSYFPFGSGPRICIGEQFAWMEGTLLLATLARHWRPILVDGHPIILEPRITLRSKHGVKMTIGK